MSTVGTVVIFSDYGPVILVHFHVVAGTVHTMRRKLSLPHEARIQTS